MKSIELRSMLLSFNIFLENEFFEKYINLIIDNQHTEPEKFKTQNHHVIPLHVYKYLNLPENNAKSNIVVLHYKDHILAHFYLFNCVSDRLIKRANYAALQYIIHNPQVPESESELLLKLPEYQKMYDEYCILNSELQKGVQVGEKNPFYGKHHTEETRKKMREHSPHLSGKNNPFYGKHLSDEAKAAISAKNRGRPKTEKEKQRRLDTLNAHGGYGWWIDDAYCKKLSNSLKGKNVHSRGRKHINNGIEAKMVTVEELDDYLSTGWKLGRLPYSDEARQHYSEAGKRRESSTLGRIWVTNGTVSHSIFPEEFDEYHDLGYYRGRTLRPYTKVKKIG